MTADEWLLDPYISLDDSLYQFAQQCLGCSAAGRAFGLSAQGATLLLFHPDQKRLKTAEIPLTRSTGQVCQLKGVDRGALPSDICTGSCIRLLPLGDKDIGAVVRNNESGSIDVLEVANWRSTWTSSRFDSLQHVWARTDFRNLAPGCSIAAASQGSYAAIEYQDDKAGRSLRIVTWTNGYKVLYNLPSGLSQPAGICRDPTSDGYLLSLFDEASYTQQSRQPGYEPRSSIWQVKCDGANIDLQPWRPFKQAEEEGLQLLKGEAQVLLPDQHRGIFVGSLAFKGRWRYISCATPTSAAASDQQSGPSCWLDLGVTSGYTFTTAAGALQWCFGDLLNGVQPATQSCYLCDPAVGRLKYNINPAEDCVRKWRLCLASNMAPGQPGVDTFIKELVAEVGQGRMAARSPGSGEPNLRALVMVKAARRRPVEEALDVLFAEYGLGQQLVSYVSGKVCAAPLNATLERGIRLAADDQWVSAIEVFEAVCKQANNDDGSNSSSMVLNSIARALLLLGRQSLKVPEADVQVSMTLLGPNIHPLQHIAAAWVHKERGSHAQAVGHALCFMVHPAVRFANSTKGDAPAADSLSALLRSQCSQAVDLLQSSGIIAFPSTDSGKADNVEMILQPAVIVENPVWKSLAADSTALTELLGMSGLQSVKTSMFEIAAQVEVDKERAESLGQAPAPSNFNACFYGNPGTGKTTVARLYAQMLEQLGALPASAVVETNGAYLLSMGLDGIKKELAKLEGGGVLFIDEAYTLNPISESVGRKVLDFLLPEMENRRGKLVVVLAGYEDQMNQKIMQYNEGMPSRFPLKLDFPDYTDAQLREILHADLKKRNFRLEDDKHGHIAVARLGRRRQAMLENSATGFANARDARNVVEAGIRRQSIRCYQERVAGHATDLFLIKRDDLLGPRELDVSSSKPMKDLKALVGLDKIKQAVDGMMSLIKTNAELEELERPPRDLNLNRVFLGNPGTGKTTVAKLYGEVLRDLGLLSRGKVVVKTPADFIGDVIGLSEKKTLAILKETEGCVLVIDEAYGLYPGKRTQDPFKVSVIETLVAKVQGVPGADRCVIMCGYPDEMKEMFRNANPGLARRFQFDQPWVFEDYTKDELLLITRSYAKQLYKWELTWPVLQAAVQTLEQRKRRPNFGNAGEVRNLLQQAISRFETRTSNLPPQERIDAPPVPADFKPDAGVKYKPSTIFSDLIGCTAVMNKLKEWQSTIEMSKRLGKDPLESFELNFRFVGPPGTGKTTVARRMGQMFHQLGILASPDVVEVSAGDFTTGYVGQSANKTNEIFESALGQVLFIDEAYRLNPGALGRTGGSFMSEAVDEIVKLATDIQFKGKMVVILAGYKTEIDELLQANPGLRSRFTEELEFKALNAADAVRLLLLMLKKEGMTLDEAAQNALPALMQQLIEAPGWSSGRDLETWIKRIFRKYAVRAGKSRRPIDGAVVTDEDLQSSLLEFIMAKGSESDPQTAVMPLLVAPTQRTQARSATTSQRQSSAKPQTAKALLAAKPEQMDGAKLAPRNKFWRQMQDVMEQKMERSFKSLEDVKELAMDSRLPEEVATLMQEVVDVELESAEVEEQVREWQQEIRQELQKEEKKQQEAKQKRKRITPQWRCRVCGQSWCTFMPYIESYTEVDE